MKKGDILRVSLNQILRDVRINPNRRALCWLLKAWMDAEKGSEERAMFQMALHSLFGKSGKINWGVEDDSGATKQENETEDTLRSFFSQVEEASKKDALFTTDVQPSGK